MIRRRTSNAMALLQLASSLPWFVGLGIALCAWLAFHYLSLRWGAPMFGTAMPLGATPGFALLGAISRVLQYGLPTVFAVGALVGLARRARRRRLFAAATNEPTQLLVGMTWKDFEKMVADTFARIGYEVREKGGARKDGGVDLILYREGKRYPVQCKQWKSKVGVAVIREMLGIMSASGAVGGFVVSAGGFTRDAMELAAGRPVVLIDGERLSHMMRMPSTAAAKTGTPNLSPKTVVSRIGTPTCPTCNAVMVKRVAKTGRGVGEPFWGCPRYPGCRGTRTIA